MYVYSPCNIRGKTPVRKGERGLIIGELYGIYYRVQFKAGIVYLRKTEVTQ